MSTKVPIEELPSGVHHRRPMCGALLGPAIFASMVALALELGWMYRPNQPIREGTLAYVGWMEGQSGNFLARSTYGTVPGGNGGGSGKVDMHGRLFPTHLEVTFRKSEGEESMIIPMDRLTHVTFGDAGIADPSAPERSPVHATTTASY